MIYLERVRRQIYINAPVDSELPRGYTAGAPDLDRGAGVDVDFAVFVHGGQVGCRDYRPVFCHQPEPRAQRAAYRQRPPIDGQQAKLNRESGLIETDIDDQIA